MSIRPGSRDRGSGDERDDPNGERICGPTGEDAGAAEASWWPFTPTCSATDLTDSEVYDVLRSSRRREVIAYLLRQGGAPVREVTDHVAAEEYDVEPDEVSSEQRKRVYTALCQCHLLRLDEFGVVAFDEDEKYVALADVPDRVARYLTDGTDASARRVELLTRDGRCPKRRKPTMEVRKLFTDDRAVSPVVGVALLIAVAVILAAVIGAVVLGLGTGGVETPQAQLQADFDGATVTISHNGGEPLPAEETKLVSDQGEEHELTEELTAGNSYSHTFGTAPDEVAVIWEDPNSDSETVIEEFEA